LPIDILCGTDAVRKAIEGGRPLSTIEGAWRRGLDRWERRRTKYLLYR